MAGLISNVLLACFLFGISGGAITDKLSPCKLKDEACHKKAYQQIVREIATTGVPELNIPPGDPFKIERFSLSLLDLAKVTVLDGVAKGIKDCVFNKVAVDLEKRRGIQDMTCNLSFKGHYQVTSSAPALQQLLGGNSLNGDGKVKIKIQKLHLKVDFPFHPTRHSDGEIYMDGDRKDVKYEFEVLDKVVFSLDKLLLDGKDISTLATGLMNENWKLVISKFGKGFSDKAVDIYYALAMKFFSSVPAKYFIADDLTPYV